MADYADMKAAVAVSLGPHTAGVSVGASPAVSGPADVEVPGFQKTFDGRPFCRPYNGRCLYSNRFFSDSGRTGIAPF